MKRIPCLFLLAVAFAPALLAQQATPGSAGRLQVLPPASAEAPAPPPVEPEVTLIPEQVPPRPKPVAESKADAKSKTEESAEDLLRRIRFREAKVKAARDPQVQAEWDSASKAKTDLEKREALKRYYKALYGRVLKLDKTLKKEVELRQRTALHRLEQNRIDPTEPLDPQERNERFDRGE